MAENELKKPDELPVKGKETKIDNPSTEFNQYIARILASKWIYEQLTQFQEDPDREAAGHS